MKSLPVIALILLLLSPAHLLAASVDTATGNLKQDIELFNIDSPGLPSTIKITHESKIWNKRSIGRGWSHTFDLYLEENKNVSPVFSRNDLYGQVHAYYLEKGKSVIEERWGNSTLILEKNGSYTVKTDNGTYQYNKEMNITAIVDRSGAKTDFFYANGKLTKVVAPERKTIAFAYGAGGKLAQITDPDGNAYPLAYDDNGSLSLITYPDGSTWRFENDPKGMILAKTDRQGHTTTYTYDNYGRMLTSINHLGKVDTVSYSNAVISADEKVRTTTISRDGEVSDYTIDTSNWNISKEVNPKGGVTEYKYDKEGNKISSTDPDGRTSSYTYDSKRRMTSMRDPDGNVTTYGYDAQGNQTSITGPDGEITAFIYDTAGNVTSMTDPDGNTTTYKYDAKGRLIAITDPLHGTVRNEYDSNGRQTKTIGPDGKAFTYVYDAKGNLTSIVGPDGKKVQASQDN